jgi:hypothetical protein
MAPHAWSGGGEAQLRQAHRGQACRWQRQAWLTGVTNSSATSFADERNLPGRRPGYQARQPRRAALDGGLFPYPETQGRDCLSRGHADGHMPDRDLRILIAQAARPSA